MVDNGGGKSNSGSIVLHSSFGQSSVQVSMSASVKIESGYLPGVRPNVSSYNQILDEGWNMVSLSVLVGDRRKTVLYPSAVSQAFGYVSGYLPEDTLEYGHGYWMKFSGDELLGLFGTGYVFDSVEVHKGWNMIGMLTTPLLASSVTPVVPVTITSGSFFGFSTDLGYFSEDTLKPGHAYWVKLSSTGRIVLSTGSMLQSAHSQSTHEIANEIKRTFLTEVNTGTLTIKDAKGKSKSLIYSSDTQQDNNDLYELPPVPPAGIFDARYASNLWLESAKPGTEKEVPVIISGANYPLSISWEGDAVTTLVIDGKEFSLSTAGSTAIERPPANIVLRLSSASTPAIPTEYALTQNYPNPFNPLTIFDFQLPIASHVSLKIYDLLGREIATIVNEPQDAGFKSVEWNARDFPSGVYFYKLQAGSFSSVRKMMLLK